jgi:hypothetical protein
MPIYLNWRKGIGLALADFRSPSHTEGPALAFLSPKLMGDALHRSSPDSKRLRHLQDTYTIRNWPSFDTLEPC